MNKDVAGLIFTAISFYFLGVFLFLCNGVAVNITSLSWLVGQVGLFMLILTVSLGVHASLMEKSK